MLRRDFETFFLGTAMTISTRGRRLSPGPKKAAAALYRRGRRPSLAKTSRRRNNLAPAARLVPERGQAGERMTPRLGWAFTALATGFRQHVFQLGAGPPRIGIGGQGKLLGHDLADIKQISRQWLGCVGLGIQHRLTALRIALLGQVLLEDDPKGVVEVLRHRVQREHAGLHDPAAQPTLDHDLASRTMIDGDPGGKRRQAQETEAFGDGGALAIAGDNIQPRSRGSHPVEIDDSFDLRFLFIFRILGHFLRLYYQVLARARRELVGIAANTRFEPRHRLALGWRPTAI